jgi:RHS repeat-associated protein
MDVAADLAREASCAFGNRVSLTTGNTSTAWAANFFSIPPLTSNPGTTATTSLSYDDNGNVTEVGTTTFYAYDFDNRLTQSSIWNGTATTTTTYAYDPFGNRISQTASTTTTLYPSRYYSLTTTTTGTSTVATSTDYLYSGGSLFGTVDQKMVNGTATGTAITRYNHADNLGSTNVTSDANGNLAQWFDYASYGSVIASENTGTTTAARQYIGQFADATGLSYLNARYYNGTQGQFTSEDSIFLGNPSQQNMQDPQSLNSYSYSEDNPIIKSDPNGKFPAAALLPAAYGLGDLGLGATIEFWGPPVAIGVVGAGAVMLASNEWQDVAQNAQNYNNNRGGNYRYIPFSEQGREVQLPGPSDPLDPWDGWEPDNGWKGWIGAGLGLIGAATDIYQQAQELPSNNQQSNGTWTSLPPIVRQGGSSYYRNNSGLLSAVPQTGTSVGVSSGGGSGGGLPSSVSQGGVTYYRNSSGLLSASPGK